MIHLALLIVGTLVCLYLAFYAALFTLLILGWIAALLTWPIRAVLNWRNRRAAP